MEKAYKVTDEIEILPSLYPVPSLGQIPVNAFIIKSKDPVLVDTGLIPETDAFMEALGSVIDPQELKWIWLTHTDQDHIGSLHRLLDEVPHLRVITSFLGMGKMGLFAPLPPERVVLLNPGQSLDAGDRKLIAVRPPSFDAPETTGLYDGKSETLFSSDCFGGILSAHVENAADIDVRELREGQRLWATVDAPWLHYVSASTLAGTLQKIRELSPRRILSSHLPPAEGMTERFLETLAEAREASPFVGPDQEAFTAMLAQMTGVERTSESAVDAA